MMIASRRHLLEEARKEEDDDEKSVRRKAVAEQFAAGSGRKQNLSLSVISERSKNLRVRKPKVIFHRTRYSLIKEHLISRRNWSGEDTYIMNLVPSIAATFR